MHHLRNEMPINMDLKKRLKLQLQQNMNKSKTPLTSKPSFHRKVWYGSISSMLFFILVFSIWLINVSSIEIQVTNWQEADRFVSVSPASPQSVAVAYDGYSLLFESEGHIHVWAQYEYDQSNSRMETLTHPDGDYQQLVLANKRSTGAVVLKKENQDEVWLFEGFGGGAISLRYLFTSDDPTIHSLYFSENDQWLRIESEGTNQVKVVPVYAGQERIAPPDVLWPKLDEALLWESIEWPRELQQRLDQGHVVSYDWNEERTKVLFMLEENNQIILIQADLKG